MSGHKFIFCGILIFALALCVPFYAIAASDEIYGELYEQSGAQTLAEALPNDVRNELEKKGISPQTAANLSFEALGGSVLSTFKSEIKSPLLYGVRILAIMLIAATAGGLNDGLKDSASGEIINIMCSSMAVISLVKPITELARAATNAVNSASVFSAVLTPVLGAILTAAGKTATAAGFASRSVSAGALVSFLLTKAVLPLCKILLGISAVLPCGNSKALGPAANAVSNGAKWLLGICSVVFVGIMSINGAVAAGSDSIALKTVKFVISGYVPVIGAALSETVTAVQGGITVIKGGVGAFGIIGFAYIFIPVTVRCVAYSAVVKFCGFAAALLGLEPLEDTLNLCGSVIGMLTAAELFSLAVMCITAGSVLS